MELERDASRGAEAQAILNSAIFRDACEKVQQGVFDAFAQIDPKDLAGLQEQRIKLRCLADVMRELQTVMQTGQLARAELEQAKTLKERVVDKTRRLVRGVF